MSEYRLNSVLLTLFCCLGFICNITCQNELFSHELYINEGDTLRYRLLISDYDKVSKYPLVIFLHGSGERGNDNEAQLKWGVSTFASDEVMKKHRPIVIAPQCSEKERWGNFKGDDITFQTSPTKSMQLVKEVIDLAIAKMPVDPSRIYITGISMGGFGTFDAMTRYPELFAAAVPVCGSGDTSKAKNIAHIPTWIFHGAKDDVVSPSLSHDMIKALTKHGGHPGYTQYPEAGHFAWIAAYSDEMMIEWLFSQQK